MIVGIIIIACLLAFANGANDNSKGVATLIGGRTWPLRRALVFAAVATFMGSATAVLLANGLVDKFSGKGLVDGALLSSPAFLGCVGLAAGATVLLATRLGIPISTTHALVGGLAGVGWSAGALNVNALVGSFLTPLIVAPLMALVLAALCYIVFRWSRLRMGVGRTTCVCIEREYHPVNIAADGAIMLAATGVRISEEHDSVECFERYDGQVAGVDAQQVLDGAHVFTAGATSFARGLNDTPKIAALLIAAGALPKGASMVVVGLAIAVGGLIAVKRVAQTMSFRITEMNDGQAFTANLVTAFCVIVASRFGVPVSTTHVSCGSLFGIGAVNGQAHLKVIGEILLAWVATLPLAAALGWIAWRTFGA